MAQEKFDLDEGPVTFSTPSVLSPESYKELADRIEIILRRLKRRSDAESSLRRGRTIPATKIRLLVFVRPPTARADDEKSLGHSQKPLIGTLGP